jgi:hypothetical protein
MVTEVLFMPSSLRSCFALLLAALLLSLPSFAFDTPLSDQAVREAYFLGQRHDGSFERLLGKYTKFLPPPKTGPYISSIAFFTPFVQLIHRSDQFIGNYSAQQAALDHGSQGREIVQIFVEIQLTESYGQFIAAPANSSSHSSPGLIPRPHDFWRDFQVRILDGDQELAPADNHGHANYVCGRYGSPCFLTGATLEFDFHADAFTADTATIQVNPPEGNSISIDFDLTHLR